MAQSSCKPPAFELAFSYQRHLEGSLRSWIKDLFGVLGPITDQDEWNEACDNIRVLLSEQQSRAEAAAKARSKRNRSTASADKPKSDKQALKQLIKDQGPKPTGRGMTRVDTKIGTQTGFMKLGSTLYWMPPPPKSDPEARASWKHTHTFSGPSKTYGAKANDVVKKGIWKFISAEAHELGFPPMTNADRLYYLLDPLPDAEVAETKDVDEVEVAETKDVDELDLDFLGSDDDDDEDAVAARIAAQETDALAVFVAEAEAKAEVARVAEAARVAAEVARVAAEVARVAEVEVARVAAEVARVAEAARVAEVARVAAQKAEADAADRIRRLFYAWRLRANVFARKLLNTAIDLRAKGKSAKWRTKKATKMWSTIHTARLGITIDDILIAAKCKARSKDFYEVGVKGLEMRKALRIARLAYKDYLDEALVMLRKPNADESDDESDSAL